MKLTKKLSGSETWEEKLKSWVFQEILDLGHKLGEVRFWMFICDPMMG